MLKVSSRFLVITAALFLGALAALSPITALAAGPAFVQVNSATPQSSQASVSIAYTGAQTAGNLNVVVVGWNDSTATVSTVTDTKGNTYFLAAVPVVQSGTATQAIYYAKNIAAATAGANSVTVTFSAAASFADIRIAEYSGIDTVNPLDVSVGAQGSSGTSSSGSVTTRNANDLLIGANLVQTFTAGPGTGYTNRVITNPDGDILEDRVVTATGSYSATAGVSPSGQWIMQMVAFRAAGGTGGTPATMTANAGTTPQSAAISTAFANALAVTVKDASSNPVSGVNVTFTAPGSGASGTFSNSTATITVATNASGIASAAFTANATVGGPYTVTAAATGLTTVNFSLTNTVGAPKTMTANAGTTPQSATISTAFANALAVTVKDAGSNPVSGVNVTFTAPGSGASGTFSNSTATITVATNASGVASAPFTANATAGGPYTVTAAATGLTTVNFSLTNNAGAPSTMTANAGTTPQSATISTAFANALAVTVRDAGSNPVSGVNVTFTAPGSGASGIFSNSTATITVATNASGIASASFTANATAGGPYTVTAAATGLTTVNFSLTNNAGAPSTMTANAGTTPQSATISTAFANALAVTVRDAGSNPVSGVNVTFTAPGSGASGVFSNSTATITVATNASGVASAPFTANATAGGPYTVTAAASGLATVNFSLTNTAGAAATMTANAGATPQSAAINTAFANALAVTVKDASSNPVSGVNVTFTAPGSGASGTFSNSTATITVATNASGVASAAFTANGTAGGPYAVTAGATGLTTVNFSLTNLAGTPTSMTANAGTTPQSATISTAFATPLAVTVKDASSNPVSGVNVTFTAPGSGASGTFSNSTATITVATNASGVASAAFTANTIAGGPYTVTATAAGLTTANFSLTNTAGAPSTMTANAGTTPQSAAVSTAFASALVVTVKDAGSNPVSGVNVTFTAPGSGASGTFSNSTTTITVATNASGVASAPFTANATVGGPYAVTATASGLTTVNFSLTNTAGVPSTMTANAGTTPQSATVSTAFANALAVTVKDASSNPVSGVNVTFTAPGSGASGTFSNSTATITVATNASGVASAPFTANTTAGGPYTVTTAATGLTTVNFSLTNNAGAASTMTANAGTTPQSATISTAFANALAVTVKDASSNPVSGVNVTFTAPGSGASGTFSNSTATITVATNGSGVASAAFTANATTGGPYTVTAAATGLTTVNFSLTNTVGTPTTMTANAGTTPQSATISTAFANALAVTVKDASSNPVSGVNVTFTAPGSGASGTFSNSTATITVATNASGVASAPFTANATAGGPYTVTAAATGLTTVNFSLTNTAGAPSTMTANAGTTPQSATINTAFANALAVTVKDASSNPVSGVNVTFTAPGSGASGTFSNSTATITVATNASGVASAPFTANATTGGPYTLTAAATGLTTVNFSLTNTVGTPTTMTANAGTTPQSATISTAFANALAVTVKDASSNPVSGVNVTFTAPGSGASGTFSNSTATITVATNGSGVASAPFTANATAGGPYTVTAAATGLTTVNFSLTNSAGAPSTMTANAGTTPQSATTNTAFANALAVTVKDASSNPVSGVNVTFTAPGSGASGVFSNSTTTIVVATNASGVASASFTANATAGGPYTVTATATGLTTVNFSLTNLQATTVITYVQGNYATPQPPQTSVAVPYSLAQAAGDLNVVVVGWNDGTATVSSVTDSKGNTYLVAAPAVVQAGTATQVIYYAKNIAAAAAGTNTVTVTFSVGANAPDVRIVEYSGLDPVNPVDVSVGAQGNSASSSSGSVATTNANELLVAANLVQTTTTGPGTGFTSRFITNPDGDIVEDRVVNATGSYSATAPVSPSGAWIMQMVAFRAAPSTPPTFTPPSNLTATASGPVQVNLTWTAATETGGTLTGYRIERCTGSSCANFVQIGSSTTTSYSDTSAGLLGSTTYSYRVRATDGVNFSAYSNTASATTAAPTFTAPSNLGASVISGTQVNLSWTAATETGGTITSYLVERCTGSPCNFAQVGSSATTSYSDTGLTAGTSYSYRVRATDGTNFSAYSNTVTATPTANPPSLSTLSLTQGPVGASITITGTNFGSAQQSSTITFGGTPVTTVTSWSTTSIDTVVPTGANTGNVIVTVSGAASNGLPFTVTPPPSISGVSPNAGPIGTSVNVTGTNFGPTVGTRASGLLFNGVVARTTSWSDTLIVAPVPVGAATGNVVVSVGGVNSNPIPYTVTPGPNIASVNPTSGSVGTPVTISGAGFGATLGSGSGVTFNGVAASPTSWSDTSIVTPVPTGATTGNVIVTNGANGLSSNGVSFTVNAASSIKLIQSAGLDAGTTSSASLPFTSNNTAGNFIAVVIRAGGSGQVFTVSDSHGNTYRKATGLSLTQDNESIAIYYAEFVAGGANTVTVKDTISGTLRFAILEYSGIAISNSFDAAAVSQGNSTTPSSGNITTSLSGDLLLGEITTSDLETFIAGTGYTIEQSVPNAANTKLIVEDQIQASQGFAAATATLFAADPWGAAIAAFKAANGAPPPPISVSVSPTSASVGTGAAQNFTATTQYDLQNKGVAWSLSGAGCSGSTCGSLTNVTITSVTYNAPASAPSPATVTLTATSISDNTKSSAATITIIPGGLSVSVSPKRAAVTLSATQTVQLTATVFNDPSNSGVTWSVDGNNGGTATSGTVSATGLYTPGTQPGAHTVTATSVANAAVSASSTVAVTDLPGVYMHHNDLQRTGQNVQEYALTPASVNTPSFTKLFSCPTDGYVYAQPLWVANLVVGGVTRNVLFLATEHDSVYAYDADSSSCIQLWKTSFINGTTVTTMSWQDTSNGTNDVYPEIGITSTPVIDPVTKTIYVLAKTKETVGTGCSSASPCYISRLHALDITTGAEKSGGPAVISAPNFDSHQHFNRPALLLINSTVYIGFGAHGDGCPWYGWLFGYDPATLAQKFVWSTSDPTSGCNGASIWDGGAGPAADASGNIYFTTGNGFYDGTKNFSESVIKLSPTGALLDWFTPFNVSTLDANDIDMGSAGTIILPDSVASAAHPHLALATGKIAILYLLDISQASPGQTKMGKFNSSSNNDVQEVIPVPPPNTTQLDGGNYSVPAYWNGNIYTTGQNFPLSQYTISNGVISSSQHATSSNLFPPRGGVPSVSASGTTNGIVWVIDYTAWPTSGPSILDAYDATNAGTGTMIMLYSSPSSGTGAAGPSVKFTVPTVANGKVYVGGQSTVTVFGLLAN